jgi:hypothetical protein
MLQQGHSLWKKSIRENAPRFDNSGENSAPLKNKIDEGKEDMDLVLPDIAGKERTSARVLRVK